MPLYLYELNTTIITNRWLYTVIPVVIQDACFRAHEQFQFNELYATMVFHCKSLKQ